MPQPVTDPSPQIHDIAGYMHELGHQARAASRLLVTATTVAKDRALANIAEQLQRHTARIKTANAKDMAAGRAARLSEALLDRLYLDAARIAAMVAGCEQVAKLADPVGAMTDYNTRPNGLQIAKMRVPLGVIGIIYESRPNVTVDAAILCVKSGNAVILRGGSEAIHSNRALADCLAMGLAQAELPHAAQLVTTTARAAVDALIQMPEYVDMIIPRGGHRLIAHVSEHARVPVIKHLAGLCHVYVDTYADVDKAIAVAYNAKARRYGICGAMETLLVAAPRAAAVLPSLCARFLADGIELRGCAASRQIVAGLLPATAEDWHTEYLDAILAIRIVADLDAAIAHIATYGTNHTDAIITEQAEHQARFMREVDSSSVMVNASTQFADGFEYGLGAEIGISTDKLHVRGPVGLEGLTSQKYIVIGDGAVRA